MDDESTASESARNGHGDGDDVSVFSDDSSFYGGKSVKVRYERLAEDADTSDYWHVHDWNVQVIAARALRRYPNEWVQENKKRKRDESVSKFKIGNREQKKQKKEPPPAVPISTLQPLEQEPFNPYEGNTAALQLDESIDDFLARLKPSAADSTTPWLYCAYFNTEHRDIDADIPIFKQVGGKFLEDFLIKKQKLEASLDPNTPLGVTTRKLTPDRKILELNLMQAAKKYHVTTGKWMLFPSSQKVDRYWAAVVRSTAEGRLGVSAKVATQSDKPDEPSQLICVFTKDINDEADIKRVLIELVRLKLAPALPGPLPKGAPYTGGQIWYKPDCYTYLDIVSGNDYKIRPTLYGTSSLLTVADMQGLSSDDD